MKTPVYFRNEKRNFSELLFYFFARGKNPKTKVKTARQNKLDRAEKELFIQDLAPPLKRDKKERKGKKFRVGSALRVLPPFVPLCIAVNEFPVFATRINTPCELSFFM